MELFQFKSPSEIVRHPVANIPENYPSVSLLDFIGNLSQALEILAPDIDFYPAYPETVLFYEDKADRFRTTITWDVQHMSPHQLGGKARPNPDTGTREVKPRLRREVIYNDGTQYELLSQLFQAFIKFDIWALTGEEAERIAYWFQLDFMAHYGHVLGSPHVRFYERVRDLELLKINNRLQTRSLVYYVQLQENTVKPVDLIQRIATRIQKVDSTTS